MFNPLWDDPNWSFLSVEFLGTMRNDRLAVGLWLPVAL